MTLQASSCTGPFSCIDLLLWMEYKTCLAMAVLHLLPAPPLYLHQSADDLLLWRTYEKLSFVFPTM